MTTVTQQQNRLLIADDQEISRLGLRLLLEQLRPHDTIFESFDGISAIEMSIALDPALAMINIQLPKLDGISAARAMRSAGRTTKILMLSSQPSKSELFAAFEAGADGYCSKNNSKDLLSTAICSASLGAVWIDPSLRKDAIELLASACYDGAYGHEQGVPFLSDREHEVLSLLIEGASNKEMAGQLGVGIETIKTHMRHVMEKLSVTDRTQAAIKALRLGLLKPCKQGQSAGG